MAAKGGKIRTLKEAKKWLNQQGWVDAPQVAAKRWRAIKLQHDGREIDLWDWRDFRGHYVLLRWNVEDWNEGEEQSRLLNLLPDALVKQVTENEAKRPRATTPSRRCSTRSTTRRWRTQQVLTQEPRWPGTSRGSPCEMPSWTPFQGIVRRQGSGTWMRVRWAARRSVTKPSRQG